MQSEQKVGRLGDRQAQHGAQEHFDGPSSRLTAGASFLLRVDRLGRALFLLGRSTDRSIEERSRSTDRSDLLVLSGFELRF